MAEEFTIQDSDLAPIKDSVVIITGGSSGIGLATAELVLQLGAVVVSGDIRPPPEDTAAAKHAHFTHVHCDVTVWTDQTALFAAALARHGRVDHVFANAGVATGDEFTELEEVDGHLPEPKHPMLAINLYGQVYTVRLGVHYLKKNGPAGGSVVVNSSSAGFAAFSVVDYTTSKAGTLGLVRAVAARLRGHWYEVVPADAPLPAVRVNAVAPFWTRTAILPAVAQDNPNFQLQEPIHVARVAVAQMADRRRHGEITFVRDGRYFEVERGYAAAMDQLLPTGPDIGERHKL